MKHLLTITALFLTLLTFSQEKDAISKTIKETSATVHSIKYTVNSIKELQKINWDKTKEIFKKNKPEELISLAFEIDLPESKHKYKSSVEVGGKTEDLDSLIKIIEKAVKVMVKITDETPKK